MFAVYVLGMGCLIIATGVPVYIVCIKWKNKPKAFDNFIGNSYCLRFINFENEKRSISLLLGISESFNVCVQKTLLVIPEEKAQTEADHE